MGNIVEVDKHNVMMEKSPTTMTSLKDLPEEILSIILSKVDAKSQVYSCRLVCKSWRRIVENESLRSLAANENIIPINNPKLDWYFYYAACSTKIFGRNILQNPCGKDKFQGWQKIRHGGHRWTVECPPKGCSQNIPIEAFLSAGINDGFVISCFATSFSPCEKEQTVTLKDHQITSKLMDQYQPPIQVSEWYAPRFDCASKYSLEVTLLDKSWKAVGKPFTFEVAMDQWTEATWSKVEHTFENYGPGVKYIRFHHCGCDAQFWAGHYGAKMTLGCIKLLLC